jgi:hypothetical protein
MVLVKTRARFEPGDAPRIGFGHRKYTSCSFRVMSLEKVQSAIIPKLGKAELLFFALHF